MRRLEISSFRLSLLSRPLAWQSCTTGALAELQKCAGRAAEQVRWQSSRGGARAKQQIRCAGRATKKWQHQGIGRLRPSLADLGRGIATGNSRHCRCAGRAPARCRPCQCAGCRVGLARFSNVVWASTQKGTDFFYVPPSWIKRRGLRQRRLGHLG